MLFTMTSTWSEYPSPLNDGRPGAELYAPLQGSPGLDGVGAAASDDLRQMANMTYSHAPSSHVQKPAPYSVNGISLSDNVNLLHPAAMGYPQPDMYSHYTREVSQGYGVQTEPYPQLASWHRLQQLHHVTPPPTPTPPLPPPTPTSSASTTTLSWHEAALNCNPRKQRRERTTFTRAQLDVLEGEKPSQVAAPPYLKRFDGYKVDSSDSQCGEDYVME
ncbi:hypothetical protein C0Q70_14007 [Pomacea canaliculata]|uniref:Homeobox domain-containing protein n=1 Tax=Pomacea canaliculata TaxID=400727 RepID=A0A2T7NYV7_POMCA|nr:hypothetical protein C0Q70_14007 [Pomacea canaliculata]